jgi:5-methyltetrahydrofolate--homocysteine methyltransferase
MDKTQKEDFAEEIAEEYEELREDHYDSLKVTFHAGLVSIFYDKFQDRKYLSIEEARKRGLHIDWVNDCPPGSLIHILLR